MKFGPVPLDEAEGAILAHSVGTASGRLRKGQRLTATQLDQMRAEGLAEVICARLDPGDVGEDEAAARLARALVPDPAAAHLRLTDPFTGRVNLIADVAGVVDLDVAAITALNRIDPMLTVATVPQMQQMTSGGMVATIKVISYAVPGAAVAEAEALLRDRTALRLRPVCLQSARLIVTTIPGGAGEKGVKAIAARLEALGMTLTDTVTVPHREDDLSAALTAASDADMTLILTGSATSDAQDVAPAALRHAGGQVERFGMPVDPGNLLFVGDLAGQPVIGLPGCARSPALNGADWVLSRIACGVPVTDSDIAGMGVGGLLKEIPTRPQPRAGRKSG
ncbi:molybdopterin-binding protein [Pseudooceanicola sp.]|uniref:molybdopterin-binding protein n=1 Tax=Pseudooceanicola sp. TaxID=1914328 RepID=UPI0035C6EA53